MMLNVQSTETVRLIMDGENGGKGVWRWGKRDIIPVATLSPPEWLLH